MKLFKNICMILGAIELLVLPFLIWVALIYSLTEKIRNWSKRHDTPAVTLEGHIVMIRPDGSIYDPSVSN